MTEVKPGQTYLIQNVLEGQTFKLGPDDLWMFEPIGQFWAIRSAKTRRYLAIEFDIRNGAPVYLKDTDEPPQAWRIVRRGGDNDHIRIVVIPNEHLNLGSTVDQGIYTVQNIEEENSRQLWFLVSTDR